MDDLRNRVKELVPDKQFEVDKIFCEWIAGLKVHTIPQCADDEGAASRDVNEPLEEDQAELEMQVEELKYRIEKFKEKMRARPRRTVVEVKEEIQNVRDELSKLKIRFSSQEDFLGNGLETRNAELIGKLEEIKAFLEKLK